MGIVKVLGSSLYKCTAATMLLFFAGCNLENRMDPEIFTPPIDLSLQDQERTQRWILEEAEKLRKLEDDILEHDINSQLLIDRATYNVTKNPDVLTKYLPVKRNLQELNPQEVEKYEKLVRFIMNNFKWYRTAEIMRWKEVQEQLKQANSVDDSTRYMVSASIVELFHNRPDVIKHTMKRKGTINMVLVDHILQLDWRKPPEDSYYNVHDNSLVIPGFWNSLLHEKGSPCTILHEFVHAIDAEGMLNFCDGIIFGITDPQKDRFIRIRDEMANNPRDEGLPIEVFKKDKWGYFLEFPAYSIEMFYQKPEAMKQIAPKLYNWFVEYFRLDPIDLKQDAILN